MATITEPYPPTSTSSEIISPSSLPSTSSDSTTSGYTTFSTTTTKPYPTTTTTLSWVTTLTRTTTVTSTPIKTTTRWTYTTSARPTIPPTPTKDSGKLSTGAIVGIAVGIAAVLIALTFISFLIWRRRRRAFETETGYRQNLAPMQENRHINYGGRSGGGGGGIQGNSNNNGTGLGITSNNTNASNGGGGDLRASQDHINAASSLDTAGGHSSQSSGIGYNNAFGGGSATALGSRVYGNDDDYRAEQQSLQPRRPQLYYPTNQALSYTPPTEPDIAPEDRYDPTYAARRGQEAVYMNHQQQQLYIQSQQQQQQKQQQYLAGQLPMPIPTVPPVSAGSLESQLHTYGGQDGYRPENRFSADSQAYLERLRGGFPPTSIEQELMSANVGGSVMTGVAVANARTSSPAMTPPTPIPPIGAGYPAGQQDPMLSGQQQQQQRPSPSFVDPAVYVATGTSGSMAGSEDYVYPESDSRRVSNSARWPSPRPLPMVAGEPTNQPFVNNDVVTNINATESTTQGELTPPMANRFAEGEASATGDGYQSIGSTQRLSGLSQASSTVSSLNHKRLNSPQVIPSPKRAPQALYPEAEPTITMNPPRE
ncbi:hypothetical protein BGZ95_002146 [Linnemannia exigua]|uniref:Uncharacterized protein n=1 Tax=Linnemannia exigua TaxID=604196 RepID=A0AAD4D820_9FUNG|nr:hypothetical protein BGZ95_002146 [Linnemannia exigua]